MYKCMLIFFSLQGRRLQKVFGDHGKTPERDTVQRK